MVFCTRSRRVVREDNIPVDPDVYDFAAEMLERCREDTLMTSTAAFNILSNGLR